MPSHGPHECVVVMSDTGPVGGPTERHIPLFDITREGFGRANVEHFVPVVPDDPPVR